MKAVLDIGCGMRKRSGSVGVDINPRVSPDLLHDLNVVPYPFEDSTFDEIYADNIIEHLNDVITVMEELHRIGKPGAVIKIRVPYFRAQWAFIDPTHRHFFTLESFSYFDPDHAQSALYPYSTKKFKIEKALFNEDFVYTGVMGWFVRRVIHIVNRHPMKYEKYFSHLFPLDELTFYIKVLKPNV